MNACYAINRAAVAHETFGEETVVINFERGTYFSLRQSAPVIWKMLQNPMTTDDLLAALGPLPPVAQTAVLGMVDKLLREGCLVRTETDAVAPRDPCVMPGGAFTPPVVEAFHDLTVLMGIELVPVNYEHEFQGWPVPVPAPTTAMAD